MKTVAQRPRLSSQSRPRQSDRRGEAGSALVAVLLVMVALLGLGMTALWVTTSNLQVGATANLRNQALYVAEAGIERTRADLSSNARNITELLGGGRDPSYDNLPTGTGVDGTGKPNGLGAVYFVTNPDATVTILRDVDFPPATFNRGAGSTTPMSTTMGQYTVWIRNDTAELRQGGMITTDTNSTVVLRSRGVAADGRTQVVLEVTMSPGLGGGGTFCYQGKDGCEDNSSTMANIYAR